MLLADKQKLTDNASRMFILKLLSVNFLTQIALIFSLDFGHVDLDWLTPNFVFFTLPPSFFTHVKVSPLRVIPHVYVSVGVPPHGY